MSRIDETVINTIRILAAEGVEKAKSGHPGLPMGAAPMAYTLWAKHLKHNPNNSSWLDRDRFVLSAGHGSMLLYTLLHLFGYKVSIEDLKSFRQWGSKTPGHPEYGHTDGVEITTGPLGQGIANAVGMAIAEEHMGAKFNKADIKLVDHYTYVLSGDGCQMEGISSEAASLAGTLGLGKLILLYDSNSISIEGSTDIAFREDVAGRFAAYGWQVLQVEDGNSVESIDEALTAGKNELSKPTIIIVKTEIGYGCPSKQGKASAHGEPLGVDNLKAAKEFLKHNFVEDFYVPDVVKEHLNIIKVDLDKKEKEWNELYAKYEKTYPELAKEWELWNNKNLTVDLKNCSELFDFKGKMATRNSSFQILNKLANILPNLIGGSADLAPSNKTYMKDKGDFSAEDRNGSNLHFGVREHAMAAIANGITVHGGLKIFVSTFFVFSDYMKGAMRLSALMKIPVVYVLTHDSIGVGEDGPTHEPIEQLAALRSIPNFNVIRPADSKETAYGWISALERLDGPTALILTRQDLPLYDETSEDTLKGGYILKDSEKAIPDLILMASGSEVELIYEAQKILKEKNIHARVVSMPSMELFDKQSMEYKEKVLPNGVRKRIAVEAASYFGWHKYVGLDGDLITIDHFGASAPAGTLFKEFGFTVENVVKKAIELVK
ncbi:MAG TPA: transketolase [Clostridiaceae bacterium]